MSSSEEFCDSSTEGYLSDDSECLDVQEIETEERVNQELQSERVTTDKEIDSQLQAHMDEPLADEKDNNKKKKQQEKSKQEEVLKKRQAGETRTGD